MDRRWIMPPGPNGNGSGIAWEKICALPSISALLWRKNFADASAVDRFLRPRLRDLGDPFELPMMQAAVARILRALDEGERIVLFGDYDVDGVTSLALLATVLRAYGGSPALFLPSRMDEGYGLSRESVARCCEEEQPQLLIAVDCGTSSVSEISELTDRGIDTLVIDHHEPKSELPACVAIVNPKTEAGNAHHYLCSVGLVFKLCHALLKTRPLGGFDLKSQLDLVALGTVADIVPLEHENRTLVHRGARELGRTRRVGIRKLMEISAVYPPIVAEQIGFRLGPRLNAAGRLSTAEKSLRLLLTDDDAEATELAAFLDAQNQERQQVEKSVLAAAETQAADFFAPARDAAIVVGADGWHPGVLGIVASRLVRKFHRPAIVIGFDEHGVGKGSGRSIAGFSLVDALEQCTRRLVKFGGHEMAAGLTIARDNFENFASEFRAVARALLTDECLEPCLHVDHELRFADMNDDLLRWHEALQPFGNGNPQPLFFARAVVPAVEPEVLKEKHLVLRLRQDNRQRRAIFFDGALSPLPPPPWDVAFRIQAEEYEGETRLQMHVQALRTAERA